MRATGAPRRRGWMRSSTTRCSPSIVPVLRAWLAFGSGQGDPLAALPAAGGQGVTAAYAAEHRPLLMLAMGRPGAAAQLAVAAASAGARGARLRVAGAALLARRGERDAALALLEGNGAPIVAARALVRAGRPLPGAIAGADSGMAELLVRLALDLHAQELTPVAAMFARLGTWLAPDNSEAWMVAAELLSQQGKQGVAVPLLAHVGPDDPFAITVRDQRIRILLDGGDRDAALADALAATRAASAETTDWVRLGEVYGAMGRQADAAEAYGRALAVRREGEDAQAEWALWLMRGGALDEAGNWPDARSALQQAYRLAPEQPFVLNYLGYAQLVRHENAAEAERLIREAHRRAPDNSAITDSLGWALYLRGNLRRGDPDARAGRAGPARRRRDQRASRRRLFRRRPPGRGALRLEGGLGLCRRRRRRPHRRQDGDGPDAATRRAVMRETAYAKINLALHVRERACRTAITGSRRSSPFASMATS